MIWHVCVCVFLNVADFFLSCLFFFICLRGVMFGIIRITRTMHVAVIHAGGDFHHHRVGDTK